ncbi:MAG: cysteine desulfurase [Bryobacterales bacterium]|nr:cysteine desulfurase [Bryobacterales bacterium]
MNRYYFDHNATTPVSPEVLEALVPALKSTFGNASSVHQDGQQARQELEAARLQVCRLLNCSAKELVLLSGGTEADNLALFGSVRPGSHVVTTAIEHPAVLNACAELESRGVAVTYVRPSSEGLIEPSAVSEALLPTTALISVMHANNETGVLQPIEEIGQIALDSGVLFHSDGVQAVGKVPVNLATLPVDLYSVSAHKFYAPKGTGALYVRSGVQVTAVQYGGRHERSRRAGTENVPGAIAMGVAAGWMAEHLSSESFRIATLRDRLEAGIRSAVPNVVVNGGHAPRVPNTTNISFEGIDGEAMVIALDLRGFAVSTGAACSSGAVEPSHVLTAMGLSRSQARSSIRFSLGRINTAGQVDALIGAVAEAAAHLRKLSPTYA